MVAGRVGRSCIQQGSFVIYRRLYLSFEWCCFGRSSSIRNRGRRLDFEAVRSHAGLVRFYEGFALFARFFR